MPSPLPLSYMVLRSNRFATSWGVSRFVLCFRLSIYFFSKIYLKNANSPPWTFIC